jgi:hypothetical protein
MQASTPLAPKAARRIALLQGLFFGISAGCLVLLFTATSIFIPLEGFSVNVVYTLAFIAFFFSGWRAAKKTSRIDMGALAGFWAGVVVAIFWLFTTFAVFFGEYLHRGDIRLVSIVSYAFSGIPTTLLALLFGPAIGALGGFIGKMYTENSMSQTTTSNQSPSPLAQPIVPVQPTHPSPPLQNEP